MNTHYLVTGGAGFIGSNYVHRLLLRHENVTILDNLCRSGSKKNLKWLEDQFAPGDFRFIEGDIRDKDLLIKAVQGIDVIIHLAAQVAVTTSVTNPREDFEVNALGTFNVLEAARSQDKLPVVLYASTNKVYGNMEDISVEETGESYRYVDYPFGISESYPLDFHSPYGCSKGTGDQYVHDYSRIYGIPTIVLRQSCIFGERQFGIEDQGWVAWFIIAALTGKPITIYGDGKQVRDLLYIQDLLDCYDLAIKKIDISAGQIFNVGGGTENTLSVWTQFGKILEKFLGKSIPVKFGDWRPGDQKVYVSDIRKAQQKLGWNPGLKLENSLADLFQWVKQNPHLFETI